MEEFKISFEGLLRLDIILGFSFCFRYPFVDVAFLC